MLPEYNESSLVFRRILSLRPGLLGVSTDIFCVRKQALEDISVDFLESCGYTHFIPLTSTLVLTLVHNTHCLSQRRILFQFLVRTPT